MRIKCFDLGKKLGVAMATGEPGGVARLQYFDLLLPWGKNKTEIFGPKRWRAARTIFDCQLLALATAEKLADVVYYEMPMGSKQNRAAEKVLTGLELALEEVCWDLGIPLHGVAQPALKLWGTCTLPRGTCDHNVKAKPRVCTGRGNAKKPDMIAAANAIWGLGLQDDNVADAAILAALGAERAGMSVPKFTMAPEER